MQSAQCNLYCINRSRRLAYNLEPQKPTLRYACCVDQNDKTAIKFTPFHILHFLLLILPRMYKNRMWQAEK